MSQFDDLKKIHWIQMIALIGGGATIYMIPYMKGFFYDTMIATLGLTHLQLGQLASIYGLISMIGYFPGGWLADRVSPRILVSSSLAITGACGFYYATLPSFAGLMAIHVSMILKGLMAIHVCNMLYGTYIYICSDIDILV